MAIRNIVKDGDPILKKKCREVTEFDDRLGVLLDDMQETLTEANGLGLAAPQVGILRRICIVLEINEDIDEQDELDENGEPYEEYTEDEMQDLEALDGEDEEYDDDEYEIDGEMIEFINPEIISTSGNEMGYEGCLSFPDRNGAIERPTVATVHAFDRFGKPFERTLKGINARCICHECNHLDGITILDLADHFYEDIKDEK